MLLSLGIEYGVIQGERSAGLPWGEQSFVGKDGTMQMMMLVDPEGGDGRSEPIE